MVSNLFNPLLSSHSSFRRAHTHHPASAGASRLSLPLLSLLKSLFSRYPPQRRFPLFSPPPFFSLSLPLLSLSISLPRPCAALDPSRCTQDCVTSSGPTQTLPPISYYAEPPTPEFTHREVPSSAAGTLALVLLESHPETIHSHSLSLFFFFLVHTTELSNHLRLFEANILNRVSPKCVPKWL